MQLTQSNIDTVRKALSAGKLAKFDASIAVLQESIAQNGWVKRGSTKSSSGFYQGLTGNLRMERPEWSLYETNRDLYEQVNGMVFCLQWGRAFRGSVVPAMTFIRQHAKIKCDDATVQAWADLCTEREEVVAILDAMRPAPTLTPIGLSPRVTTTLTEMNLDLDLSSIKMAKIGHEVIWKTDENGKKIPVVYSFVDWTKGIKHGRSRFSSGCQCHACGKHIPSQQFVPVEALDKKTNELVSLWLGCDCAKNIFGIRDVGITQDSVKKS